MNRRGMGLITVWCAMLLVSLMAQGRAQQAIPGGYVSIGEQYFRQYCGACHGVDGRGDGPAASMLRIPPPDLTRIAQRRGGHFPDAEIAAQIDGRTVVPAHGSRDMPIWGVRFAEKFGGDELGEEAVRGHLVILINHLKTLQR
jgi:mono/diheme cytochrome c family protein